MSSTAKKLDVLQPGKPPARWNYRHFGRLSDPVHKSSMAWLISEFACLKSFKLSCDAEARGEFSMHVNGKSASGTAGHETLRRALMNADIRAKVLAGDVGF